MTINSSLAALLLATAAGQVLAQNPAVVPASPGAAPQRKLPPACAQTEWPPEARRYELEGATAVEYRVGKDGRVVDIRLIRSSGWQLLDGMAVRTLAACKFDTEEASDRRYTPIEFRWALTGGYAIRPELKPNSCVSSDRFASFVPLDKTASGRDGVLVRLLVNGRGEPFNVRSELRKPDAELAAKVAEYVQTCRFASPSKGPEARTDTTYGRVLFR